MTANTETLLQTAYETEAAALLRHIPEEFYAALKRLAWDRGHSCGYSEVLIELETLVEALKEPLDDFASRLREVALDAEYDRDRGDDR